MENKVIIEGQLLSQPKITEFNSTLFKVKNTRSFKKKDGSPQEFNYIATISARGPVAEALVKRFTKGDMIRIEGNLTSKNTKKIDEEGNPIWETWVQAYRVDAMVHQTNLAPLPASLQTSSATQKQKEEYSQAKQSSLQKSSDIHKVPLFKKQVAIPHTENKQVKVEMPFDDEDPFGDRLPF